MQVLIAVVAFLAGAVTVFAVELGILNDTLSPVRDLVSDLQSLFDSLSGM